MASLGPLRTVAQAATRASLSLPLLCHGLPAPGRALCSSSTAAAVRTPSAALGRASRAFSTRTGVAARAMPSEASLAPSKAPSRMTQLAVGGVAVVGIIGLGALGAAAVNGISASLTTFDVSADQLWTELTHRRVADTYWALGEAVAITAASASLALRSNALQRFASLSPGWALAGAMVMSVGTMLATMAVPKENVLLKNVLFATFTGFQGFLIAPLAVMGGPVLLRAAALTGGIVGSLSFIAINSPSDKFLFMGGPLCMGLAVVAVSSFGAALFPAAAVAPIMHSISLYGGVALFSAFVLYDTSKIVTSAKHKSEFDPINECLGLYMDVVNLFVRLAIILGGGSSKRK